MPNTRTIIPKRKESDKKSENGVSSYNDPYQERGRLVEKSESSASHLSRTPVMTKRPIPGMQ